MTLDDLIALSRETLAHDAKMTPRPWAALAIQHRSDDGDGSIVAEHAEVTDDGGGCIATIAHDLDGSEIADAAGITHARTAAPTMAAALVALGPALVEWREAHAAVAAVGPAYRAAERSGDPDAHFAASIALDDAKHRREASNRALAAALDTLNAAPAAGKG